MCEDCGKTSAPVNTEAKANQAQAGTRIGYTGMFIPPSTSEYSDKLRDEIVKKLEFHRDEMTKLHIALDELGDETVQKVLRVISQGQS